MATKKKSRANNHRNKQDKSVGSRGELRRAHFADGGSTTEWRGRHVVHSDRKNKRKTRSSERRRAIDESEE